MTNHTPAPRPCALWGVKYTNAKYAEIVDNGTLENPCWTIVMHTDTGSYDNDMDTPDYKQAEAWVEEAITAIYQALHPWLDVADMLTKVFPREQELFLLLLDDKETVVQAEPWFGSGCTEVASWLVDIKGKHLHFELNEVVAIKPLSWIIDPTSEQSAQDRERLKAVNAWEELRELAAAYDLTNRNTRDCFEDNTGHVILNIESYCQGLPWTLVKMPDVDGITTEGIDDLEALADEPLKHYVWVEGMQLPSKSHSHVKAVKKALRLSQKEKKMTIVCTDIIKPVTRAEIVELEKG